MSQSNLSKMFAATATATVLSCGVMAPTANALTVIDYQTTVGVAYNYTPSADFLSPDYLGAPVGITISFDESVANPIAEMTATINVSGLDPFYHATSWDVGYTGDAVMTIDSRDEDVNGLGAFTLPNTPIGSQLPLEKFIGQASTDGIIASPITNGDWLNGIVFSEAYVSPYNITTDVTPGPAPVSLPASLQSMLAGLGAFGVIKLMAFGGLGGLMAFGRQAAPSRRKEVMGAPSPSIA